MRVTTSIGLRTQTGTLRLARAGRGPASRGTQTVRAKSGGGKGGKGKGDDDFSQALKELSALNFADLVPPIEGNLTPSLEQPPVPKPKSKKQKGPRGGVPEKEKTSGRRPGDRVVYRSEPPPGDEDDEGGSEVGEEEVYSIEAGWNPAFAAELRRAADSAGLTLDELVSGAPPAKPKAAPAAVTGKAAAGGAAGLAKPPVPAEETPELYGAEAGLNPALAADVEKVLARRGLTLADLMTSNSPLIVSDSDSESDDEGSARHAKYAKARRTNPSQASSQASPPRPRMSPLVNDADSDDEEDDGMYGFGGLEAIGDPLLQRELASVSDRYGLTLEEAVAAAARAAQSDAASGPGAASDDEDSDGEGDGWLPAADDIDHEEGDGDALSDIEQRRILRARAAAAGEAAGEADGMGAAWVVRGLPDDDEDEEDPVTAGVSPMGLSDLRGLLSDVDVTEGFGEGADAPATAAETKNPALMRRSTDSAELAKAAEALLNSLPAHKVRQLEEDQNTADEENEALKGTLEKKRREKQYKTHKRMRIIGGEASGKMLVSSQGETTRPMMEKVRAALFNMLTSAAGGEFPQGTRWLDLFAGTGAIGIEAISRGSREGHFVELDPWVAKTITTANFKATGVEKKAVLHVMDALQFIRRAETSPKFAGGAFDFLSVCPPYAKVSYTELMGLLNKSPLIHAGSIVIVEYAKEYTREIPQKLGPLARIRDRKYGRTLLAIYGPASEDDGQGELEGYSTADELEGDE